MIPHRIKYENHLGQELWLDDSRFFIDINDLRNYSWNYDINNNPSGFGGRVTRFTRGVTERSVHVGVRGREIDFVTRIEQLHSLSEVDILANRPGRLWFKNEYIRCFLAIGSELTTYSWRANYAQKELTVLLVDPFWTREVELRFEQAEPVSVANGKRYTGRNPMRYAGSRFAHALLNNEHYAPCPARIIFDTPGENPTATIGGRIYKVHTAVRAGEQVVVNQAEKSVTHLTAEGQASNIFDLRDKEHNIFEPIVPGEQDVLYLNAFTLVLLQQRSEPRWN